MTNKIIGLTALAITLAVSTTVPTDTFAAENNSSSNLMYAAAVSTNKYPNYPDYDLGPKGLEEALKKTGSNALVMDLYALTILKQANADFSGITGIKDNLENDVMGHQKVAKENAKKWLDQLKPELISVNEGIINYDRTFQNYYDELIEVLDQKDKKTFAEGINELSKEITSNKEKVDNLVKSLSSFRDKVSEDTNNFKKDANHIQSILESKDAGITVLQEELDSYMEAVKKYNDIVIGTAVATAVGPIILTGGIVLIATGAGSVIGTTIVATGAGTTIGGGIALGNAKKEMDNSENEIKNLTLEISQAKMSSANLKIMVKQTSELAKTIDMAIDSLEKISTKWQIIDAEYKSVCENVEKMTAENVHFIKPKLNTAKDSWADVRKSAEEMYKSEIKVVKQ
ncbi:HBL/NHE enterotoxin family protein [Bacillus sp. TH13]|uniref:HBL/NHE enterotoxin family protein n=1 Tax=Bacillus sp. TH13 TaxID=2796379 RepID=UPI00191438D1|nr:HBL/NHE enterotoxin family protein [Bacillus sp. TH13]MBK5491805.1 alpha-helical pore-forming toxin family protein [Bacillus sp. TH13]